ncbi:MAG: recombinase family protein [Angelakisella sp.]|nr:recombinase family protein [Angelakisella sp.]
MLCAVYCRISREDEEKQTESESIQNQKSLLIRYALEHQWEIYSIYCDEDYSGMDAQRPDFNRMLTDAQAGRFQIVLCKTQSRFTRDMELVERYIHGQFPLWGIRFVAVADHVDTDIKGGKKARQINGLINEWYLEDLSENIRMVFDYKRRQGHYIGGFPAYGYQKDPQDKNKLVIDTEAAQVVRQIYQWCLEGHGKQYIANKLNDMGVKNPTKYKQQKGWGYVNGAAVDDYGLWNKTTVSRILHNEMYTGVMVQGRKKKISYKSTRVTDVPQQKWIRVEGTHEAIIDAAAYQRVQELIRPRTRTDSSGQMHPLSGLVKCMDCKSTMSKTSNGYEEKRRSYLRCKLSVTSNKNLCSRHSIRLDELICLVQERLKAYISNCYELGDVSRFEAEDSFSIQIAKLQKELQKLDAQIQKHSVILKSLYIDKVSGVIEEKQFVQLNGGFLAAKNALEQQYDEKKRQLHLISREKESGVELTQRVQTLLQLTPMPRELLALAVGQILIGEKNQETGQQKIHIQWNF